VKDYIKVDIDFIPPKEWLEVYFREKKAMLERLGFEVIDIIARKSDSQKGLHISFHIEGRELSLEEKNMLNWLCCDDPTRVKINILRIKRGIVYFSKLFSKVLWRKPLEEPCASCKLIKYLKEVENEMANSNKI
jgi:hypothetical protein